MAKTTSGLNQRKRRHIRVRKKVAGTSDRPRLSVFRSANHIYAQVIDDDNGNTIASASTVEADINQQKDGKTKVEIAAIVGKLAGERATEKGVNKVVFDRAGFKYHGRVKALAEGARKAGLDF
ncbi:MAG: 50S ribosomal protein L18 [SAR202 cluster bacterium]|nr:50S ribosomal protein L18 [SAR202 cluster bacterium]|tara:strand:+ start:611 stop:979 length:369 start_codon:yes stop_codon:yes gene_type:complete